MSIIYKRVVCIAQYQLSICLLVLSSFENKHLYPKMDSINEIVIAAAAYVGLCGGSKLLTNKKSNKRIWRMISLNRNRIQ